MSYAVLYNVFCCWMVTVIGLTAVREIRKNPTLEPAWSAFAYFWLFASLLWGLAGLRLLAYFLGMVRLDRFLFYLDEIFAGLNVVACVMFFSLREWGRGKITQTLLVLSSASVLAFWMILAIKGIVQTEHTPWASEHEIPRAAFFAFLPAYIPCMGLMIYATIRDVVARLRDGKWVAFNYSLATAALALYALGGIADLRGVWAGWQLLLIRLLYIVAALAAFWVARSDRASIRIVHRAEAG